MTLSKDHEERVREALGVVVDTTPPGVGFEDLLTAVAVQGRKRREWPGGVVAVGTAVVVILVGVVSLVVAGGLGQTGGVQREQIMSDAEPVEFDEVENSLPDGFVSRSDDHWYSIPAGEFRAFVLDRTGEAPHVYATSCDVLNTVDLPDGWEGSCLEMTVDGVRVTGVFGYDQALADNTYADESGFLWYATDCPNADVLLSSTSADGLPNIETTSLENVEAIAQTLSDFRVIPRNGWVWEGTGDGGYRVLQAEDFMLERTIEADKCPLVPVRMFGGVPVAYRIDGPG